MRNHHGEDTASLREEADRAWAIVDRLTAENAEQAAEVERLRAALERLVDVTERIHGAAQSGSTGHDMFCNRDDCYVVDEMAIALAALAATLAATPVAPAPNSAPNPPAPHRCRECDDGPNLSFPEPTHAPPAPGELANLIRQQQASGGGPVTAVMVSRSGDESDPTTPPEPAP